MTSAVVRFTSAGFHRWPGAPAGRAYLASSHRHLFHVRVELEVKGDDREVEFHDLLDFAGNAFGSGDFGAASCEMMAGRLAAKVAGRYPGRFVAVDVFEDGEVGGRVSLGA